jgi:hypothetical protein
VLAAEHLLGLAALDFGGEFVEPAGEIVGDRLAGLQPFHEDGQIFSPAAERLAQVSIFLEPAATLLRLLRGGLVLPEIRRRDALFYLGEFFGVAGIVKDSSADRWRGAPSRRTCEAARLVEESSIRCRMAVNWAGSWSRAYSIAPATWREAPQP